MEETLYLDSNSLGFHVHPGKLGMHILKQMEVNFCKYFGLKTGFRFGKHYR